MAQQFTIDAKKRSAKAKQLLNAGNIPAVVYGQGAKNTSIEIDQLTFRKTFASAGYTSLIELSIDGEDKPHTVLVRDIQKHPVREQIIHIDFYQPDLTKKIRAHVPLQFIGEAPAVKNLGGVFVRPIEEVDVEALPADIPHDIKVDITQLTDFDKIIHISDLAIPEGVKLYHADEDVICLVQAPRTEAELEADLAEEVTEDVESVEGVEDKKDEESEGEGEDGKEAEGDGKKEE